MTREFYEDLLVDLGYNPSYFRRGSLLRHDSNRHLPRVYFNTRDGLAFFTVWIEEARHFPSTLWRRIDNPHNAEPGAVHMEVVPLTGKEKDAFANLRNQRLSRPAIHRL